jgi:chromodomain-helicase-DNA-binding protein 7
VRADCALLHSLAAAALDPRAEAAALDRLGPCGTRAAVARLRRNHEDLARVRAFEARVGARTHALVANAPRWEAAPQWWDAEFDVALVRALADFGLLFFLVWIVDPERPFLAHVPAMSVIEFSTLADVERERA